MPYPSSGAPSCSFVSWYLVDTKAYLICLLDKIVVFAPSPLNFCPHSLDMEVTLFCCGEPSSKEDWLGLIWRLKATLDPFKW